MNDDHLLASYDYHLPAELIAQSPVTPRDSSRLLVLNSLTTQVHSVFRELPQWLRSGDLLVLNNTRVIPARLYGQKTTGAPVEILLLEEKAPLSWLALVKPGKRFKRGSQIWFPHSPDETTESSVYLKATVIDVDPETGGRLLQFEADSVEAFWSAIEELGKIPLPPYVTSSEAQPGQYQTVYAQKPGAVAAPTAGLHFTPDLLQRLQAQGIQQSYITLHVGVGTFRPVEVGDITQHQMHSEWLEVPSSTVEAIAETKARGGRVIAVGTTVVRSLEGVAQIAKAEGKSGLIPFRGRTDLFIYPGYSWQVVEGMITNFHLPRSSLLMLVSALIGRERLMSVYQTAIDEKYRFYSFGDGMLILPEAVKSPNYSSV
ncbi:S-adenosylmethionine/tRNA-ribosyltransferase-isomerase [Rippkaea orientalis PCC 8801]|uniref:S-adenosylmethionine:tRNA ribosyltransferase-isomerase n=1 Tax=Rippkaea orientalis (strain PCC 8801 / RF-1) TaxID=41431 RepID=B7JVE6_RIPO1|nr:tRNA preQ1(34) S-adenosylmethionine ribosyltransferase-isomerase QueA [Rippkaea orientalis]ACK68279.1 S-adenosylmethionine/tRNA-ribosyltransferase-isomerase [Rippkaea orientalis PCC 8801]